MARDPDALPGATSNHCYFCWYALSKGVYAQATNNPALLPEHAGSQWAKIVADKGKAALPMLNPKSALLTLTYLGALRVLPNYNTMGLAKASLEASVRYMAESLGGKGTGMRVNAISAGPKTLAASGIAGFGKILGAVAANSPIRRNVTTEEVGNVAAFLLSDLASGVTAEITYVDGGFSQVVGGIAEPAAAS